MNAAVVAGTVSTEESSVKSTDFCFQFSRSAIYKQLVLLLHDSLVQINPSNWKFGQSTVVWNRVFWMFSTCCFLGFKRLILFYMVSGLYASFLKGQGHQGIFSLVKGALWGNCKFLLWAFQGHQSNDKGQRRQSPPLPPWDIRPVVFSRCFSWNNFLLFLFRPANGTCPSDML